ncbi:unnamed protein product [Rhizophagus irregularis]|uniref:Oxidoreductase N-terminal domain-containing protein n=1 Tax=Rhizophagus irregularis TaxID=588596 RepID=A0A915Z140_9GLOM|nr:unnamed protein product [Rhizophagus irregularis]
MAVSNKGLILKEYPKGLPNADKHFELVPRTIDIKNLNLGENEIVVRNIYLSLDPYVRFTLREPEPEYVSVDTLLEKRVSIGQVIIGVGVSEVVKTNNPNFKVGDLVYGPVGWEQYSHIKSDFAAIFSPINKESLKDIPLSYYASLLRMGGLTPYASLVLGIKYWLVNQTNFRSTS